MDILKIPISITNWIILADCIKYATDRELYIKIFKDYSTYIPIYKIDEICTTAYEHLSDQDFQIVMEALWRCIALLQE